jgi:alpha-tubulin suppressor-like RCC1 family protein
MVRAGFGQTCAINPYEVAFCWGGNQEGQLGDGTQTNRTTPARVAGGLHWHQLTAGGLHTCGVTTDNRAYCWGNNGNGEVGDSSRANVVLRPSAVAGGLLFRQIDAGYAQTCALTTGDRAYCWGFGGLGQLGDGTTHSARLTPRAVAGTLRFDHLRAGGDQTCGVTLAGQAFCWGANYDGEIGDGTTINRLTPTALAVDLPLGQVAAGYGQTCAVTTGDRAYCWGDSIYGQLGDGTIADRYVPVPVLGPL